MRVICRSSAWKSSTTRRSAAFARPLVGVTSVLSVFLFAAMRARRASVPGTTTLWGAGPRSVSTSAAKPARGVMDRKPAAVRRSRWVSSATAPTVPQKPQSTARTG